MKTNVWLTVNKKGVCRVSKGRPRIDIDEVSVNLVVSLPDGLFTKPRLEATITVPDEAAVPDVVNAIVADNTALAIEQATGLKFAISIATLPQQSEI